MKKKTFGMLLCLLLLVLGGAMIAGCGKKKDNKTDDKTVNNNKEEKEVVIDGAVGETVKYNTLEEYFATSKGQKSYKTFQEGVGDEKEGITYEVKGNVLSVNYMVEDVTLADYTEEERTNIMSAVEDSMKDIMDSIGKPFREAAQKFEGESGIDGIIVELRYVDTNKEHLYSEQFTAE